MTTVGADGIFPLDPDSTARAALNYQHAANGRDKEIASALDALISKERAATKRARKRTAEKPPQS
jgi:hypothetical protein